MRGEHSVSHSRHRNLAQSPNHREHQCAGVWTKGGVIINAKTKKTPRRRWHGDTGLRYHLLSKDIISPESAARHFSKTNRS
jgi:hypothetical protein